MSKEIEIEIEITESEGNVFANLGLSDSEGQLVKAKLAIQINRLIGERGLKQVEAAELLGIDQPKVSALCCGRLSGFSIERLFRLLAVLNQDIEIKIKPHNDVKSRRHPIPHIRVVYVAA